MDERRYDMCGVVVGITSQLPEFIQEFDNDFKHFQKAKKKADIQITISLDEGVKSLPSDSVIIGKDWYGQIATLKGGLTNLSNTKRQLIDIQGEQGQINCFVDEFTYGLYFRLRSLIKQGFVALMEERGIFHIHGAAVSKSGVGVIINGGSNAGKTRAVLSLVGCGFNLVTDDLVLLSDNGLIPFKMRCDVDLGHLINFPQVHGLLMDESSVFGEDPNFWSVHLDGLFPGEKVEVSADKIVFLNRLNSKKSRFEEISSEAALKKLMGSYPEFSQNVLFTSRKKSGLEVAGFYSTLLEEMSAYNFYVGIDTKLFAKEFQKLFTV